MTDSPLTARREIDWTRVIVYSVALLIVFVLLSTGPTWGVSDQAKRADAKASCSQLVNAAKVFATEYGFPPTGTNAQILATLRGSNPRKVVFFECRLERVNASGELIDMWGTPFRIDTTNPAFPWAYSFGKDKRDDGGAPGSDDITSWPNK